MSFNFERRRVVWFSCGAASAVAAKIAVSYKYPSLAIVYCDTSKTEHPDNARFFDDIQRWTGRSIEKIRSEKYASVDDVFAKTGYMVGVDGARCTAEMKKIPRFRYQKPGDVHIFGFTYGEKDRINNFVVNNPELDLEFPLLDRAVTKDACLALLQKAGIEIPTMYRLGFRNNNCLECVKATSPRYWSMVREHFPEVFANRVLQSRILNVKLLTVKGKRRFLDYLPAQVEDTQLEDVSCGPECGIG